MGRPRLSRTYRVVALLVLLGTVWTSAHRQQDDDACVPVVAGENDASKHTLAPAGTVTHEHCAICHWMRGLKPAFSSTPIASATFRPGDCVSADIVFQPAQPIAGRLPARAPPALL